MAWLSQWSFSEKASPMHKCLSRACLWNICWCPLSNQDTWPNPDSVGKDYTRDGYQEEWLSSGQGTVIRVSVCACVCTPSHSVVSDSLRPLCPCNFSGKTTGAGSYSRGSSGPRNQSHISCIGRWILYHLSHLGSPTSAHLGLSLPDLVKENIVIVGLSSHPKPKL